MISFTLTKYANDKADVNRLVDLLLEAGAKDIGILHHDAYLAMEGDDTEHPWPGDYTVAVGCGTDEILRKTMGTALGTYNVCMSDPDLDALLADDRDEDVVIAEWEAKHPKEGGAQ